MNQNKRRLHFKLSLVVLALTFMMSMIKPSLFWLIAEFIAAIAFVYFTKKLTF